MSIEFYPDELDYAHAKLDEQCGDFLKNFIMACLHADGPNYELLRPALHALMQKYPQKEKQNADSGSN